MFKKIFYIFLIWRIGLFIIAWCGARVLFFSPRFPYADVVLFPSRLPDWIWTFANFDGVHYLTIASRGYSSQYTQVFFPLYPLLIRFCSVLLPFISPVAIGITLSSLFFLLSLVIFWKLLILDYSEKEIYFIFLFLIFFPVSFFWGSLYTESLFLLLSLLSFYFARKKKWLFAAALVGIASATRLTGIFLLPALLWEQWQDKLKTQNSKLKIRFPNSNIIPNIKLSFQLLYCFIVTLLHSPILYLAPLGLIFYMIYLQTQFGDYLYFWHAQPVFGAERSGARLVFLPQVIWRYLKIFGSNNIFAEAFWIAVLEFVSSIGAIFLLILAHLKRVRFSYLLFAWLTVIVPTLTGTFSSMPRYVMLAFPIYIVLGLINNKIIKNFLFVIFCLLLIVLTVLFSRGHWVS